MNKSKYICIEVGPNKNMNRILNYLLTGRLHHEYFLFSLDINTKRKKLERWNVDYDEFVKAADAREQQQMQGAAAGAKEQQQVRGSSSRYERAAANARL